MTTPPREGIPDMTGFQDLLYEARAFALARFADIPFADLCGLLATFLAGARIPEVYQGAPPWLRDVLESLRGLPDVEYVNRRLIWVLALQLATADLSAWHEETSDGDRGPVLPPPGRVLAVLMHFRSEAGLGHLVEAGAQKIHLLSALQARPRNEGSDALLWFCTVAVELSGSNDAAEAAEFYATVDSVPGARIAASRVLSASVESARHILALVPLHEPPPAPMSADSADAVALHFTIEGWKASVIPGVDEEIEGLARRLELTIPPGAKEHGAAVLAAVITKAEQRGEGLPDDTLQFLSGVYRRAVLSFQPADGSPFQGGPLLDEQHRKALTGVLRTVSQEVYDFCTRNRLNHDAHGAAYAKKILSDYAEATRPLWGNRDLAAEFLRVYRTARYALILAALEDAEDPALLSLPTYPQALGEARDFLFRYAGDQRRPALEHARAAVLMARSAAPVSGSDAPQPAPPREG